MAANLRISPSGRDVRSPQDFGDGNHAAGAKFVSQGPNLPPIWDSVYLLTDTRIVDRGTSCPVALQIGTWDRPYSTLTSAIASLPAGGGAITLVEGDYSGEPDIVGLSKPLALTCQSVHGQDSHCILPGITTTAAIYLVGCQAVRQICTTALMRAYGCALQSPQCADGEFVLCDLTATTSLPIYVGGRLWVRNCTLAQSHAATPLLSLHPSTVCQVRETAFTLPSLPTHPLVPMIEWTAPGSFIDMDQSSLASYCKWFTSSIVAPFLNGDYAVAGMPFSGQFAAGGAGQVVPAGGTLTVASLTMPVGLLEPTTLVLVDVVQVTGSPAAFRPATIVPMAHFDATTDVLTVQLANLDTTTPYTLAVAWTFRWRAFAP